MPQPFQFHVINSATNGLLEVLISTFGLSAADAHLMLQSSRDTIARSLAKLKVDYDQLGPALTPRPQRYEVAFVFDSSRIQAIDYGYVIAEAWIPALRAAAPKSNNSILTGDITSRNSPSGVALAMSRQLIARRDYTFRHQTQFHVVYITNLGASQRQAIDMCLFNTSDAYVGYVDCSTSSSFKRTLFLPQLALRARDTMLMPGSEDTDIANAVGYPFVNHGFRVGQVNDDLYGLFLHFRINNDRPEQHLVDGAMSLMGLAGVLKPLATMDVTLDKRRYRYLLDESPGKHGQSLRRAGLMNHGPAALAAVVKTEVAKNFIYNLRFKLGERDIDGERVSDPDLDALLFSVQIEISVGRWYRRKREVRRLQVGIKYFSAEHRGEITTLYD